MSNNINCINIGDAFLLDTPPKGKHLFVAIMPITNTKYLFVSITKNQGNCDSTCIINPGAAVPSFIIQESVIYYQHPKEIELAELQQWISDGKAHYKGKFSRNIVHKIQTGATQSDRIPIRYATAMENYLETT